MGNRRWTAAIGLSIAFVSLAACDNSAEPPERFQRGLGKSGSALPTVSAAVDAGILRDQKSYKESDIRGRVDAVDARGQVTAFIEDLMNALAEGEIDVVLEKFRPDDIMLLQDSPETLDELYITFSDTRDALETAISNKLGPEVVEQVNEQAMLFIRDLNVEVRGATSASVTPNLPLRRILGPLAAEVIAVEKTGGQWLIHLESPLTEENLSAIRDFHKAVANAIDELIEMVNNDQATNADQITKAREMAMDGQSPEIGDDVDPDGTGDDGGDP